MPSTLELLQTLTQGDMDFVKNAAMNAQSEEVSNGKDYMPKTKSSYYRLTEGLKSFWKSTGATPEIRMNNLFFLVNSLLFAGSIFLFKNYGNKLAL